MWLANWKTYGIGEGSGAGDWSGVLPVTCASAGTQDIGDGELGEPVHIEEASGTTREIEYICVNLDGFFFFREKK